MATPQLALDVLSEGQNGAESIVNDNSYRLDALCQLSVKDRTNTPPGAPVEGDRYLIGAAPTGVWAAQANKVAWYVSGWKYLAPKQGFRAWVDDEKCFMRYNGTVWYAEGKITLQSNGIVITTTTTSPADLKTISIPAATLVNDGDMLHAQYGFELNTAAADAFVSLYFNTTIFTETSAPASGSNLLFDVYIARTSNTTVTIFGSITGKGLVPGNPVILVALSSLNLTTTAYTLKVVGEAAGGTISCKFVLVEKVPAALV